MLATLKRYIRANCPELAREYLQSINCKRIVLTDRESAQLIVTNEAQESVYKMKLDGGLLPHDQEPKKCDWLLCLEQPALILLIELKSTNIHASVRKQFVECQAPLGIESFSNKRYILVCKVNKNDNLPTFQKLRKQFGKDFHWISTEGKESVTRALSQLCKLSDEGE